MGIHDDADDELAYLRATKKDLADAAQSLLAEAESVGTIHGHRELLVRVGKLRNTLNVPEWEPEE